jgi:hypothetical protein
MAGKEPTTIVPNWVDMDLARASRVMHAPGLLDAADLRLINGIKAYVRENESALANNPQNATHVLKECTFMNKLPENAFRNKAPRVLGKILRFVVQVPPSAAPRSPLTASCGCALRAPYAR